MSGKWTTVATWLAAAATVVCASSASAKVVTFAYTGTVTYASLPDVYPGGQVTGTFYYDDATAPSSLTREGINGSGVWAVYHPVGGITLQVGVLTASSQQISLSINDNVFSNVQELVTISGGYPLTFNGQTFADGFLNFNLGSLPGSDGSSVNGAFPTDYSLSTYNHPDFQNGGLFLDSWTGQSKLAFRFDSISSVPEPTSRALLLAALLPTAVIALKRRKAQS